MTLQKNGSVEPFQYQSRVTVTVRVTPTLSERSHLVVIIEHDQLAQPQVTPERTRLRCNTLLKTTVSTNYKCVVVDDLRTYIVRVRAIDDAPTQT